MLEELDKGFSRTGVQSFALEGLLGELQVCVAACIGLQSSMSAPDVLISTHQHIQVSWKFSMCWCVLEGPFSPDLKNLGCKEH